MTLAESIQILEEHQKWRLGNINERPSSPQELTSAIDKILEHLTTHGIDHSLV